MSKYKYLLIIAFLISLLPQFAAVVSAQELSYPKEKFPYCLNLRGQDFECQRGGLNDAWACEKRPKLKTQTQLCLSWHSSVSQACGVKNFGTRKWPYYINYKEIYDEKKIEVQEGSRPQSEYILRHVDTSTKTIEPEIACPAIDEKLGVLSNETIKPIDDVTGSDLQNKLMILTNMQLHKNKFPACIAIRTQALECSRPDVTNDWTCEKQPTLKEPTARCLAWLANIVIGMCENDKVPDAFKRASPIYKTTRIDIGNKQSQPTVNCRSRVGFHTNAGSFSLDDIPRYVPLNQD